MLFSRPNIPPALRITAVMVCAPLALLQASDFETFYQRFGEQPIPVSMVSGPGAAPQSWTLTGIDEGQLEVGLATGGGIGLSPSRTLADQIRFPSVQTETFQAAVRAEQYADAVRELRPQVYPLLRFSELPNAFSSVFDSIALLHTHLINAELYDESIAIFERFPVLYTRRAVQPQVFRLVQRLADRGQATRAVSILGNIPVESLPEGVDDLLLSFAYDLRVRGEFEALIPVYEAMIPGLSGSAQLEAQIWLAYCYLNAGKVDEKAGLMTEIGQIAPGEPNFGLFQLLEGYTASRGGEHSKALDILARGVIYARPGETWLPEANYLIGNSYRSIGQIEAARNTFIELARLNPENPWGRRAKEAHDELTPPETETSTAG